MGTPLPNETFDEVNANFPFSTLYIQYAMEVAYCAKKMPAARPAFCLRQYATGMAFWLKYIVRVQSTGRLQHQCEFDSLFNRICI